ncbi:MAG TPA: choice-of-anchor tandem repeat GloVer-containing protein [Verrucomicrobiae bacterium]|nr:choice-of-anchor tandem repeat GloVer-containing protein [Verrucomicrobiae bacterium]
MDLGADSVLESGVNAGNGFVTIAPLFFGPYPPTITTEPLDVVAPARTSVFFTVAASGEPAPTYQWLFNGTNLMNGGQHSGVTGSVLTINGVGAANAGGYTVVISNVYGSVTSRVATLTIGGGFNPIYSFTGADGDGANPYAALVEVDGTLYGTTAYGGSSSNGTVFKLEANGAGYKVLYSFRGEDSDGGHPWAALTGGREGALYGTTSYGGTSNYGTIFKLHTDGSGYAVLHSFGITHGDGAYPVAGLTLGSDGALYGTTFSGSGVATNGTVFKLNADGSGYSVLHTFIGANGDGANPYAALVQGSDGALYGTTYTGGSHNFGTLFKLNVDGAGYSVLYGFAGTNGDGANPSAGLLQGSDGALYGTTYLGGTYSQGTAFRVNPDGSGYTVLHHFFFGDGQEPWAGLVQGSDGALYGATAYGGTNNHGALFRLYIDGSGYSVFHSFSSGTTEGTIPIAALLLAQNGLLYGTTEYGGPQADGSIFWVAPPLFIDIQPTSVTTGAGTPVAFTVQTSGYGPVTYQWQFNSTNIPGATSASLGINHVQAGDAGYYDVVVTNAYGAITSSVVTLSVTGVPPLFISTGGGNQYTKGEFRVAVSGLTGQGSIVVEASTNLDQWAPLFTNPAAFGNFQFVDPAASNYATRYYRARVLSP